MASPKTYFGEDSDDDSDDSMSIPKENSVSDEDQNLNELQIFINDNDIQEAEHSSEETDNQENIQSTFGNIMSHELDEERNYVQVMN